MRPVARNLILAILGVVVVLLALGAVPGLIETGDPYYVEATPVDESGPAITADNFSEQRFPYAFDALAAAATGADPARSEAYYTGPGGVGGFKEAFTHTPFEEFDEFEARNGEAVQRGADSPVGDVAFVDYEGQRYRLEIVRVPEDDT
ncbi:hypothetical protein HWV23_08265 [Natronomonas halophila]|uniref:hypothetical protein n=1 Tax=Natronomonas halophila TaxID=2747817 RepID=UPI0015B5C9BF|nr:hypothetical protein [Natronomonas halophila]QLD85718.1 hypothetical protein HWV23_08265 [Natronomonas halophila]